MAHAAQHSEGGPTTIFGNPFSTEQHGRSGSVRMYQLWLEWKLPKDALPDWAIQMLHTKQHMVLGALPTLRGKNLACWCPLPEPGEADMCHAAVLMEFVKETSTVRPKGRHGRR